MSLGSYKLGSVNLASPVVLPNDDPSWANPVLQRSDNNTWQLDFDRNEWTGPININVDIEVIGGRLVGVNDPRSTVEVSAFSINIKENRRNNGSLQRIRGDTLYDISYPNVRDSGKHTGNLRITVTFN